MTPFVNCVHGRVPLIDFHGIIHNLDRNRNISYIRYELSCLGNFLIYSGAFALQAQLTVLFVMINPKTNGNSVKHYY
jgi:hypothetical protein